MYYCNSQKEPEELNYKDIVKRIKVCDGYDDLSKIKYPELINNVKELDFYKHIDKYTPQDQGTVIRWLYRGLTLKQSLVKIEHQLVMASNFARGYRSGTFSPYENRAYNLSKH